MKKLLALVLALVMTLGLATVSSNAATYSDADSIRYQEAVAVMSAIGVLQGDNGKFNPTQPLTREQGAKIITYMLLGQKTADGLTAPAAPFTDVASDRWSAGSIAYCKSLGILNGNGDGTVTPAEPLTGAAFAKMLLCALGYDSAREGLTGSDWQLNVARLVNRTGLSDELDAMPYNSAVTRQEAAQMALNTMETIMVNYSGNNLTVDRNGNLAAPRESVANTTYNYNGAADGFMQFVENYYPNLKKEIGTDDFGTPTVFWFNGNTRNDNVRSAAKTIATAPNGDQVLVYTKAVKVKDIYKDLGLTTAAPLATMDTNHNGVIAAAEYGIFVDGYEYDTTAAAKVTIDGIDYTSTAAAINALTSGDSNKIGGNGVETTVVYDKTTNEVTISLKNTYVLTALSNYNTSDKKLALGVGSGIAGALNSASGDSSKDDYFECVVGAKKDDLFLATVTYDGVDMTLQTLEPVTKVVVDAKVTAYKATESVTAAGTAYEYTKNMASAAAFGNAMYVATYTMNDTATYDFVLDANGYVAAAKVHTKDNVAADYVFITDVDASGFNVFAKAVFMDGSKKTITVTKVNDKDVASTQSKDATSEGASWTAAATVNSAVDGLVYALHFYTFTTNKDGNYLLTATANQGQAANKTVTSGKSQPITSVAKTATDDTVFVTKSTAYTGVKNAPDVAADDVYYVFEGAYLICAYVATAGTSSSESSDIAYLFANPSTAKDGDDKYYVYDAILNGEKTTIKGNTDSLNQMIGIKAYDSKTGIADLDTAETAKDYSADVTKEVDVTNNITQNANGNPIAYKDGTFTVDNGTTTYVLTNDAKVYLIDKSDESVSDITPDGLNSLKVGDAFDVYAFYKSTSSEQVNLVYVVGP